MFNAVRLRSVRMLARPHIHRLESRVELPFPRSVAAGRTTQLSDVETSYHEWCRIDRHNRLIYNDMEKKRRSDVE